MKSFAWFLILFSPLTWSVEPQDLYQQAVHILGGNGNVVSKWQGELRFAAIGGGDAATELAAEVISEAAEVASLKVLFPEHQAKTAEDYLQIVRQTPPYALSKPCTDSERMPCFNFVVVIATNEVMQVLSEAIPLRAVYQKSLGSTPDLHCFFSPFHIGRQRIQQAFVYVREKLQPEMLRTCLQEEIYQSLGLFNDYTGSTLFSFNNIVAPKKITNYDKALLKALYDPRVRPGYPVNYVVSIFMKNIGFSETSW